MSTFTKSTFLNNLKVMFGPKMLRRISTFKSSKFSLAFPLKSVYVSTIGYEFLTETFAPGIGSFSSAKISNSTIFSFC